MAQKDWFKNFCGSITVCDAEGIIIEMNDEAARNYRADGGYALIGSNLLDCHPEPSRTHLKRMLDTGASNISIVEKDNLKKLVHHTPWYADDVFSGIVELLLELPMDIRTKKKS